jgi:hypothetical protein
VGCNALAETATGFQNTAVGIYALERSFNAANQNAAFGAYALQFGNRATTDTRGEGHTAMGYGALRITRSGYYNTAFGSNAYYTANYTRISPIRNYNATYGTAVGYKALCASYLGSNTAIGANALLSIQENTGNTVVGSEAVKTYKYATNSTVIGCEADIIDPASVGVTNATAIGYQARVNASNMVRIGNTAVLWIGGQVAWSSASDRRLKKDIKKSDLGLDFIKKLRPVSFKLKNDAEETIRYGFIAQEVEEALGRSDTDLVRTDNTPEHIKSTTYDAFIAPLVRAVHEQEKQIEALEKEVLKIKKETGQ